MQRLALPHVGFCCYCWICLAGLTAQQAFSSEVVADDMPPGALPEEPTEVENPAGTILQNLTMSGVYDVDEATESSVAIECARRMPGKGICPDWPTASCLPKTKPYVLFAEGECCDAVGEMVACVGEFCLGAFFELVESEVRAFTINKDAPTTTYILGCTAIGWPAEPVIAAQQLEDEESRAHRLRATQRQAPLTLVSMEPDPLGQGKPGSLGAKTIGTLGGGSMLTVLAIGVSAVICLSGIITVLMSRRRSCAYGLSFGEVQSSIEQPTGESAWADADECYQAL
jgi:hypothetical protein